MKKILAHPIRLKMQTASKCHLMSSQGLHRFVGERHLIDMLATEAYDKHEIYCVGHVYSNSNPTNVLLKVCHNPVLDSIPETGYTTLPDSQWVLRSVAPRTALGRGATVNSEICSLISHSF